IAKRMLYAPPLAFPAVIASRNEPAPLSPVLLTTYSGEPSGAMNWSTLLLPSSPTYNRSAPSTVIPNGEDKLLALTPPLFVAFVVNDAAWPNTWFAAPEESGLSYATTRLLPVSATNRRFPASTVIPPGVHRVAAVGVTAPWLQFEAVKLPLWPNTRSA